MLNPLIYATTCLAILILPACRGDTTPVDRPPDGLTRCGSSDMTLPCTKPEEWSWIPIDGMICRDGSPAGISVRYSHSSSDVMIYLQEGGACFNAYACNENRSHVEAQNGGAMGIFDIGNSANPVGHWTHVYVPYCTGDVFAGNNDDGDITLGPQNQKFVGYTNIGKMLERVVPTFAYAQRVLLAGSSAGGFGATHNYHQTQQAFGDIPVILLNDSAPPMNDPYLAKCLQRQFYDVWHLSETFPSDCSNCRMDTGQLSDYLTYISDKYTGASLGMISSEQDNVIRRFYGFGALDCHGYFPVSAETYKQGLYDLQDTRLKPESVWSTFFIPGDSHVWLLDSQRFYQTTVGTIPLTTWISDLLAHKHAHVNP